MVRQILKILLQIRIARNVNDEHHLHLKHWKN